MTRAYGTDADGHVGGWPEFHTPSVSYRYGYQIGTSRARFVGQESKRGAAESAARAEAKEVRDKLNELGAPADVSWWVQERTTETTNTFEEPVIEAVQ
ncbi:MULTISPECIES: hypothetical protein [Mycobacteroides]|jgi:hypothetical protein|uniref:hypothetical protein n=1 Tax=Mycobacteroides TaxID=670516 RepID=UPI000712E318|nr:MULTISPECIES: hypothetical protein [Mycobacteroides]KRQ32559.1 hypothetical protein AOT91_11765 [Mycobacteroides sp. H092]KRQ42096.1 hypothetical protein AOT88_25340 [Mycobacteroides sp. H063]KRQ48037.1 hypothetical protein AOT92_00295 [Mycobacteroides sp. H101]KRQ52902.1 hypothetical protein AOT94_26500 [Mycobacteroides sp. HXVII]KRQ59208.1 hypothetical protein AOT90_23465 [Mycobacteroides sp. H079]